MPKIRSVISLFCLTVGTVFPVFANTNVIRFQTPLELAKWEFEGDAFHCQLTQHVHGFGLVKLAVYPDSQPKLTLAADWFEGRGQASAEVVPSSWSGQVSSAQPPLMLHWSKRIASAQSEYVTPFVEALELGYHWRFNVNKNNSAAYQTKSYSQDEYEIMASSINSVEAGRKFRVCRTNLLPKPFSYVRHRNILFPTGVDAINAEMELDLQAIALYVQADSSVSQVLVDGHADTQGERLPNLLLSQRRAENIAARLIELGVPGEKLKVFHHGTREPMASNNTAGGRQINRRVTVRLVKSSIGE